MKCANMTKKSGKVYCKENPGCQCCLLEPERCGDFKPHMHSSPESD